MCPFRRPLFSSSRNWNSSSRSEVWSSRITGLSTLIAFFALSSGIARLDGQPIDPALTLTQAAALPISYNSQEGDLSELTPEKQGDLLMARGQYAAAISAYQHAWPRSAQLWNKTGLAYHHLFALDEALKDYQMALTLDPHYADAYNNLGAVYHGKQEFSVAERAYKHAIKYEPRSAVAYCNLGTAYFAELKFKKGAKAYQKALEIDPMVFAPNPFSQVESAGSRAQRMATAYSLAKVYASAGRDKEAFDALRKAMSYGFNDRKHLMEDKELASLRRSSEFQQLMVDQHMQ